MSGIKGVLKDGWHPKGKDGGKESWRGDFKGVNQVAGWLGKGKDSRGRDSSSLRTEHASRPILSLKDPASFGPPPRHVNYHGPSALSTQSTPDRRGLGSPLTAEQIEQQNFEQSQPQPDEEDDKPALPPLPYRVDRSGLKTDNLPPPPKRVNSPATSASIVNSKEKPSVPPRAPPRRNGTASHSQTTSPPPAYSSQPVTPSRSTEYINQNAASRLSQAGVSVPALGIGNRSSGRNDSCSNQSNTASQPAGHSTVNELRTRFARTSTNTLSSSSSHPGPPPPAEGTTWAEKQAALKTARNFHQDPSTVSMEDARSAASTVNNFRARHSDQIEAGRRKMSDFNQKYGITKKINNFIEEQEKPADASEGIQAPPPPPHPNRSNSNSIDMDALNRRKPPAPPPPPKKQSMRASPVSSSSPAPPPLPLGTKPR